MKHILVLLVSVTLFGTTAAHAGWRLPVSDPSLVIPVAVQGPVEEKYRITIPREQGKIAPGEQKTYADGKLTVKVIEASRTAIEVEVNGEKMVTVKASERTLFAAGDMICALVFMGKSGEKAIVAAQCDPATDALKAALAEQGTHTDDAPAKSPKDVVADAPKGTLKNAYEGNPEAIAKGHELFLSNSCNGCHGGNGGGGMGPPLSNEVWVYGRDDDTLFRLITKGSDGLQADGYARKGRENVVGPMPPFEDIIESSDDLWKIIAFVHSLTDSGASPPGDSDASPPGDSGASPPSK